MGIGIAARASNETGLDILLAFVVEHPTIGDRRNAFLQPTKSIPHSEPIPEFSLVASTLESTEDHVSALETGEIGSVAGQGQLSCSHRQDHADAGPSIE